MKTPADLPPACGRVAAAAQEAGIAIDIRLMEESTRSAEDAARSCGTSVAQIVKSLIFHLPKSQRPLLLLVSGANRVNEPALSQSFGEKLERPNAEFVRKVTGFAIGGVPPFGHAEKMPTYLDADLLQFGTVWAAAGTPQAVFEIAPDKLAAATKAEIIRIARA